MLADIKQNGEKRQKLFQEDELVPITLTLEVAVLKR